MKDFWREDIDAEVFSLNSVEHLSADFYFGLYENGEEGIRSCCNIGGPYTLRVFEFTLSDSEDRYSKELIYALPKSIMKMEQREEARRKKREERIQKGLASDEEEDEDEDEDNDEEK